ncbi:MAG: autotransporter outer membrane beta-barrel domain-containing protein [Acidaminococcus sp.]|nr:autotransporter outer membrane beta-barrel domain-containing protein [Acidaminococcus sp.]MCI2100457.1 autotransporter outer membrane beta-barrel domain-containing protein [Acidaminococcus sp.]MCI2114778.1 autotransporter outer membrane beta-barrel domain-containing protein [Acidaminococcus sp.]MCI2116802.1 autotransporter outer membrane beta-barrel domain-containing protein [Acidaminococcus sp.]
MVKKNMVLKAAVLASLMAIPGIASAGWSKVGPITQDGETVSETVKYTEAHTVDASGSTISIGTFEGAGSDQYSVLSVGQGGSASITAGSVTSKLLDAESGGKINISSTGTVSISTNDDVLPSVRAITGANVTISANTINISNDSKDDSSGAVWAQNNTSDEKASEDTASVKLTADKINITSANQGIVALSNGQVNINGDLNLTAPLAIDTRGYATTNINTDGAHSTVINGDILFETPDDAVSGKIINAYVNLNLTGSDSSWTGRSYMKTSSGEIAPQLTEVDDTHKGGGYLALTMADGAIWNDTGDSFVNTLTADASTINIQNDDSDLVAGTLDMTNGSTLNMAADNQKLTVSTLSLDASTINLNGDSDTVDATIDATNGSTVNVNGDSAAITGVDAASSTVDITGSNDEVTTLTLADSTLNVSNSTTTLDNLTSDDSTINVNNDGTSVTSTTAVLNNTNLNLNGDNQKVTIGTLSGSDTTVNTNSLDNKVTIGTDNSSNLTVHGTSDIADAITTDHSNAQKLANVVSVGNSSAADKITTDEGVISGAYNFDVVNGQVVWNNNSYTPNQTNVGIAALSAMNLMTWRQENNDMNKRLGELRDSEGQQGVWARMVRGEAKYGLRNMKNQYNYYQVGYDHKIGKNWTLGAAYSKTDGTTSFSRGNADNDHDGFAIYGSWLGDDGSFVDLIGKYAHMDTEYHVNSGAGSGDYDNDAFSFSAEYGKRFHGNNGFWIEPQVELTYGTVDSADYTTKRGVKVHHDSMDSFVGRLGFALGKDVKAGHLYARASYLYDFDGESDVTMNYNGTRAKYSDDIGGGWWEVGIGANLNLSKASHLYIDVEKTYGGDVTTPWQWGIGYRYSF